MDVIQALVLGIVQGATEFLPISSSAHLVLVPWLLGWPSPDLSYDVLLHWGTLAAVLYYFRHDLLALVRAWMMSVREWRLRSDPQRMLAWLILVGTVPAAVLGFWFENFFSALFSSPPWVATFLLCTGILLLVTEHLGRRTDSLDKLRWPGALLVGMAQAIALAPGISRSGATIGAGMLAGLTREAATRFSFLLAIPIIFGAGLLQMLHLVQNGIAGKSLEIGVGFVAAAFTGYFCIHALLRYVRHNSLRLFAIYCWVVGLLGLGISVWR